MAPKWTRPCNPSEAIFHQFQASDGIGLVGYTLSLCTRMALEEEEVRQALCHLWRKIITLRLIILEKEDDENPWFAEMEKEIIDLESISWEDVEATVAELRATAFAGSPGPLWKVRMASKDGALQHKLVFVFHHAITDGTSSCRIMGHFMNLLNDVMAGREIDDGEQLTSHTDVEANTRHIMDMITKNWEKHPLAKANFYETLDKLMSEKPLMLDADLQKDKDVTPFTITCAHDFTEEETKKFIANCKLHKVSVHMAFSIASQIAMIELLKEKNISPEYYNMVTQHAVNNRRYYKDTVDYSKHFGLVVGMLAIKTSLPLDAKASFWKVSKKFSQNFTTGLDSAITLSSLPYLIEKFIENPDMVNDPPFSSLDMTNMGDITKIVTGDFAKELPENEDDKLASVTHLIRSSSIHYNGATALLNFHSFKGKFLYSIDSNTKYLSSESAKLYTDYFVKVMRYAAENPQLE